MQRARRIGLSRRYSIDKETNIIIRSFMALPLLPAEHIHSKFTDICINIRDDDEMLKELKEYMERQWIDSNMHPLSSISVHGMAIRTNNDTEAYHRVLNKRVGACHINMYKLINILFSEAESSRIACGLVDLNKLNHQQKKKYVINNNRLLLLMNRYSDVDAISANDLLIQGSYLINPSHVFDINSDHEDD